MATYTLTPAERRARAKALAQYKRTGVYQTAVKQKAEEIRQTQIEAENERKSQSFLVRATSTIGDITANIITGAVKGLEGIVDLGIGIVGGIGGVFDKNFQEEAKKTISYDWTMETFGNAWNEQNKYSYLNDGEIGKITQSVASGIGQMLPAVGVAFATAGIGTAAGVGAEAAQAAGQTASLVTLGVSAAGNSTEQAFQDGADYWRGLGYGVASGLVEVATEKMFGGATKALTGAGWLDDIARSTADVGVRRVVKNALEEGAEEVVSELANPTLKAIYKGADAFNEYKSADYWKGVGEAGLVGSLTALAYSGTVGYGMSKLGQGYVGKEADIADSLSELNSLKQKQVNLQDDGRYTEDTRIKVADVTKRNYENIERTLKSVSAEKRAKLIEKFSLQNAFNADGSMSEHLTSMLNVEQPSTQADGKPSTALASGLNHNNYSVLSQGNESRIMETIEGIQESARESAKKANPNITAEELEAIKIEPFNGELQSEEASAFTDFKKFVTASNKLSGLSLGWAVVSPNEYFNAAVDNEGMRITDGTIIISADNFQNGKWAESVVHEELHTAYGTKQWANLYNALIETTVERDGKKVKAFDEALASVFAKDYGFDVEKVKAIQESVEKGVELSAEDRAYIEKFEDELGSHMAELALGNEKFIAKFIGKRVSLAEKFLNKIADLKSAFERIGNAEARAEYKQLQKAEKLYIKAIESAGGQYINRKIIGIRNRDIDASEDLRYNRKVNLIGKTFPTYKEGGGTQANELATRWAYESDIQAGDQTAISFKGKWFLVEKFDDSDLGYQIVDELTEQEYLTIEEEWKNGNRQGQSIQEGISRFASLDRQGNPSIRGESNNDTPQAQQRGENQEVRGVGKEQSQRRQAQSHRGGDSESGGSSKQGLKFSLKVGGEDIAGEVEQTKNLVALHNLSEDKLKKVLELGGFPMPSIAVTTTELAHDNYGNITVIFGKDTIDPEADSRNVVYDRDAWTPTTPKVEYKANTDKVSSISKKYYELYRKYGDQARNLYNFAYDMESILERYNGEKGLLEYLYEDTDMMNTFLLDTQKEAIKPVYEEIRTEISKERAKVLKEGLSFFGEEVISELKTPPGESPFLHRKQWLEKYRSKVVDYLAEDYQRLDGFSTIEEARAEVEKDFTDRDLLKIVADILKYQKNGGVEVSTVYDKEATEKAIREAVSREEYKSWVDDLFEGVEEKKGIRNDKDIFTPSGNRRSFEQTHEEYNLQNIVNAMSKSRQEGNTFLGMSAGALASRLYTQFKSIEDMRNAKDYLALVTEEDLKAFNDKTFELYSEIVTEIAGSDSHFSRLDDVGEIIGECASVKPLTKENIKRKFNSETKGYNLGYKFNDDIADKLLTLFGVLKRVPTTYFEAKPRRAVSFNEIKTVLVPESASEELLSVLKKKKISYQTYNGKEGERVKIIKSLDNVRFSLEDSEGRTLTEEQREYFKNSQIRDENGNLLVVYHGSPKAGFTKFNTSLEGSYFTADKEYATEYAKQNKDSVYEVYLNIEKPFDTRDEKARKIFEEQFYGKWGNGTPLTERGLLDWTDGVDMFDFIQENELDYDGLIIDEGGVPSPDGGVKDRGISYVAFRSNQIKNVDNQSPSENDDIRFSYKPTDPTAVKYTHELSDGQIKKLLADYTKRKVYSKTEAEEIVNTILANQVSFGEKYGSLVGKSKQEVIEMLWRGMNTADSGKRAGVALDVADFILRNSVLENIYEDNDNQDAIDTIQLLKPYLHSIDLSGIKGEIKYHYDRDNSPYLLWGKRKGESGTAPDKIAMELAEKGLHIDAINSADIFIQLDEAYRSAVATLKKKAKDMFDTALSPEERKSLKQAIAREVLIAFSEKGKSSKLSKIIEEYRDKAKVWKDKYYEERNKNKVVNRVLDKLQKFKDLKTGAFVNASTFKTDTFKVSIEKLGNIKYRGNLNEAGTRTIIAGLKEWYSKENPMLLYSDDQAPGMFDYDISDMLDIIATGEGKLSMGELRMLEMVVDYFKHFVETYNKVYRNGEYVEARPIVESHISLMRENKGVKVGILGKLSGSAYVKTFGDPMTVARRMDLYGDGFYTESMEHLRRAAVDSAVAEMDMRKPFDEFFEEHKNYLGELEKRTSTYNGVTIPMKQAISLYMTLGREQAIAGIVRSGVVFLDGKDTVRINGLNADEELTEEQVKAIAEEARDGLASQLNADDKAYIKIAENFFNNEAKERKRKTDIARRGFSNTVEGYYFPIRRANTARNIDSVSFLDEMNRTSNASFNKDTVKGAKGELFIDPIDSVIERHRRGIAQYEHLAFALDEYNILYNLDIGDNANKPITIKTESQNVWREGEEYFRDLIRSAQGISANSDGTFKGANKVFGVLRGGYAKFQLGANPKVWLTQLSSFFASGSILDVKNIIGGIGIKTADVDKYCRLAELRNDDNTAAMAQGVLDRGSKGGKVEAKISSIGDVLMKPIGMMDRFVVKKLFGACQLQIQQNEGLKVGTEENKVKAGQLLEKVILETQQNALATERSAAMRSGNEFLKTVTMFSADSMKVIGRVIDSFGELSVLKQKRKTMVGDTKQIDSQIKTAQKKTRKSMASLVGSAVFMALVAEMFRKFYGKDDEDKNDAVEITVDAIGNLLGGLPLLKDVYARFTDGYELDNYAYSALNDLLDSAQNIFDVVGDIAKGNSDSKDVAKNVRSMFYAVGQILGIPVRNFYNVGFGVVNLISPTTAYKIEDTFYSKNYRSDLNKAIANGDDEMIATIAGIMLEENIGGISNASLRKEMNSLIKGGYDVIPKSVGSSFSYGGESYNLTVRQANDFNKIYSKANESATKLLSLKQYGSASQEVRAKAIKFIYNTYYNLAIGDYLGVEAETKNVLFAEAIDIEKLAIVVSTANTLTADIDKKGKAISGSKKAKVQAYVNSLALTAAQKYMIMGYLGYSNAKGEQKVKTYINRLSLSKSEKALLLKYSGYGS